MYAQVEKPKENKSRAVANSSPQKSSGGSTFQFVDNRPEAITQRKLQDMANHNPRVKQAAQLQKMVDNCSLQNKKLIQKKENNSGLPDNLKTGIENLSGYSMDDVKVHYNSDKPAQLQAHAYAQGTDIHLGAGQEKHLPHEAWHVVQQKQGRVKPTRQAKGLAINDDKGLENEADEMGENASQFASQNSEKLAQRKLNTQNAKTTTQLFTDSNSKSTSPVIQRAISRGKNTGWGGMFWVNGTAEALWDALVALYDTDLPVMSARLAQKAIDYPLHRAPFDLKVQQVNNITGDDVEVAYNVATERRTAWDQLITDGEQLITDLDGTIDTDQQSIDALKTIRNNSNATMQEMNEISPTVHRERLFPDLADDREAYRDFRDEINNLEAGNFTNATLTTVQQHRDDLVILLDSRRLTLSLITEATSTEDSHDQVPALQKNLIGLRGKNGVTDTQLQQLFTFYKADRLGAILAFSDPTTLIDYLTTDHINPNHLYPPYIAMNRHGKDADIKSMLDDMGVVNNYRVALLASAIRRTNGDAANNLHAMIQVPNATIEVIEFMLRQGNTAAVYDLLVTRAVNPVAINNCLGSNTGAHAVALLGIEPNPAFLLLYDACGFSRAAMLDQIQVLNIVPANQLAFVAGINGGAINNVATAETHLGTTDNAGAEHWLVQSVGSCTAGQETIDVNDALSRIVNGLGPPAYIGHSLAPKWNVTYYNNGNPGDGRLPGVLGVDQYREYYVQKPAGAGGDGRRRILGRLGKYYYTSDHYATFTRIR